MQSYRGVDMKGLKYFGLLVVLIGLGLAAFGNASTGPSGPTVIATLPIDSAVGAIPTAALNVSFSVPVQAPTVDTNSFTLTGPEGPVPGTVTTQAGDHGATTATFTPNNALAYDTEYTARLTSAILDTRGKPLVAYAWRFNTGKRLAAGRSHTCARVEEGRLKCWGNNFFGQLGYGHTDHRGDQLNEMGDNLPYVDLGPGRSAVQVVAGAFYTCARLDNAQVKCWGRNASGQLGLGDVAARGDQANEMGNNLLPIDFGTGRSVLEITAGTEHVCARLDNGQVKCWGDNSNGQLGHGDTDSVGDQANEMGDTLPAVNLGSRRRVVQITAGDAHSCARLDNGQVKCWGANAQGQLGLGDVYMRGDQPNEMGDKLPAVSLGIGRSALQIAAGHAHTCARLDNDQTKCWGDNRHGQLGLGDSSNRGDEPNEMSDNLPPVNLGSGQSGLGLVAENIQVGARHACVRLRSPASSGVKCWGYNNSGQLGLGDIQDRGHTLDQMGDKLPTLDLGSDANRVFVALEMVAGSFHNCAYLSNGRIKCWGDNASGELGLGNTHDRGDQFNEMGNSLPFVDIGN